jgi:sialic acid synthase SpsE
MLRDRPSMMIGDRRIATDLPPFVIADIGLNHGGSLDRALSLIDHAAAAGAHAVKLQTIIARDLVGPAAPVPAHVDATSLVDFFKQFELDEGAHHACAARAHSHGLRFMSTPLSEAAVHLLERVGVDAYVIASGDLTWDQLIGRCATTHKPIVLCTAMATVPEVRHALAVARLAGATDLAVLHCVSAYPVPRGSENLAAIRTLATECDVPVGLSDHSEDTFALPVAVALGASLYERHVVLDDDGRAIDRRVSSTAAELSATVAAARRAWLALGSGYKACLGAEAVNLVASRRSLCAVRPLKAGHAVRADDLIALRPATGLAPAALPLVIGLRLTRSMAAGEPLTSAHVEVGASERHRVA